MGGKGRLAASVPAGLTSVEGRRFGFILGPAFLVIAALLHWRERELGAQICAALGLLLILAAAIVPKKLGPVQRAWMRLAESISKVTVPIFMGLVYFLVISVIGVLLRIFGHNPITRDFLLSSYWVRHRVTNDKKHSMEHQF